MNNLCPDSSEKERRTTNPEVGGLIPSQGSSNSVRVVKVETLEPHPNGDRLDVLTLTGGVKVVTGKHYRAGQLGVYFPPGCLIPGYLAEDLWLKGRVGCFQWTEVSGKNMRGIESPGVFAGEVYCKVRSDPRSVKLFAMRGGSDEGDWIRWPYWRDWWRIGDDVAAYLGVLFMGMPLKASLSQPAKEDG